MTTFRTERVAEQMKHVIAHVIAHELKDPRAGFITVVGVKLSADLKQARVRFSVLGCLKVENPAAAEQYETYKKAGPTAAAPAVPAEPVESVQ